MTAIIGHVQIEKIDALDFLFVREGVFVVVITNNAVVEPTACFVREVFYCNCLPKVAVRYTLQINQMLFG